MNITGQMAKRNQIILVEIARRPQVDFWMVGLCALLILAALSLGCRSSPPVQQDSVAEFSAYFDRRIPQLLEKYSIPGVSMALVRNGQLVWSNAYGYADLEQRRIMRPDAVCRVESISKSVTAWGVMRLVEQGRLELDAPIQNYLHSWKLPQTAFDQDKITIRRLLSGNAGLPLGAIGKAVEYPPQGPMPTLRDYLNQEVRLLREPGSGFMYSNVGFNLLELLIEEASGRDFATYMAEEVLRPLGMTRASFAWDSSFSAAVPIGYEIDGTAVPLYVYPVKASGGLLAMAEDIGRFICAEMTGSCRSDHGVLNLESIRQIHEPQVGIPGLFGFVAESYGFGHFIETLSDGRTAVWHGGQGHGWMTHFHAIPESGDGIVILTNSQRSWPFMAQVLTDWSRWLGIEPVKIGRIVYATRVLWGIIGLVLLICLWLAYGFATGLLRGKIRFDPLSPASRGKRWIQFLIGILGIGGIAWSVAQPYLFVSSIFPTAAAWAGGSVVLLSILLVIRSLFPRQ
jgi:CubicO group peptidase (beta-lactamase class C family)